MDINDLLLYLVAGVVVGNIVMVIVFVKFDDQYWRLLQWIKRG